MPNKPQNSQLANKRKIVIACACMAVCFLVAVVCLQAFLPANKSLQVANNADPGFTCTIMIVAGAALAAWGYTVRQRCPDHFISRRLVVVVGLLAFWLAVVIVKYPSNNDDFIIACWYAYYIPMLAIPTLLFSCSLRAATFESTKLGKTLRAIAVATSLCLLLLVLTNNVHKCVFSFIINNQRWDGQYAYEIGYWCVVVWAVALYVAGFALLFVAARKNLRPAFFPLIVVGGIAAAYCILYILRVEFLFKSNFSLTCVILLVIAIETILDTGIFPASWHYADIFNSLPLNMKLISKNEATPKTNDKNIQIRTFKIKGGEAVSFIDVSDLNERKKTLEDNHKKLEEANSILTKMLESNRDMARANSEAKLLEKIDDSLEEKVQEINSIVDNLPKPSTEENRAIRKTMLMRVKFLTAYCKRKASLVISETEHVVFDQAQVGLIFTESASDFRSLGIECAVLVQNLSPVSPETMEKLYDAVYDEIEGALAKKYKFAMISISDAPDAADVSGILDSPETLGASSIPDAPKREIDLRISFSEENAKTLKILRED